MQMRITLIAILAIAALAYGCGGGSDSSSGGGDRGAADSGTSSADTTSAGTDNDSTEASDGADSAPLTKAQFIKQGDAVCNQVPVRYNQLLQEFEKEAKAQGDPKPSTAEANLKAAVPPLPEAAEELEGLSPPAGDEQKAEAIVAALEAAAAGLEAKPTSELSGPESPFAEFQKLTKEYGFKFCNQL
ncbi:MAG: hypothetical protein QOF13_336 [Solirubrobacterales bacterium]|jgi:hypothetical protein|nr:hypothetical protein [Solirubrobacterales bacterium]